MRHQITLILSDSVYEALRYQAQAQKKSVKQVAEETLQAATLSEKTLQPPLARIFHKKAQTSCKSLIEWKV